MFSIKYILSSLVLTIGLTGCLFVQPVLDENNVLVGFESKNSGIVYPVGAVEVFYEIVTNGVSEFVPADKISEYKLDKADKIIRYTYNAAEQLVTQEVKPNEVK